MQSETLLLSTTDRISIPIEIVTPEQTPKAVIVILPALGVRAKLYRQLATALALNGVAVVLYEQRGHGESPLSPSRQVQFGLDTLINIDFLGDGGSKFQPVYVGDVCDAMVACLDNPDAHGKIYELVS